MLLKSCTVVGAGAFGTALAIHLASNGLSVFLFDREASRSLELSKARENLHYLPGIPFPQNLSMTLDLTNSACTTDFVLIAVPSGSFEETLQACQGAKALLWVTKGFDPKSGELLYTLADRYFEQIPKALLTGPSFANEVALKHPTAVILASHYLDEAFYFQAALNTLTFRTYLCDDLIGASLGGAVKNVLAIAVGISLGLGFGANTRAALMTRGLTELKRIGEALGAEADTLTGLSGLGDLILTCSEEQSRNRRFGVLLGQGFSRKDAEQKVGHVIEGIQATYPLYQLIVSHKIYAPIATQVYRILSEQISVEGAFQALLQTTPHVENTHFHTHSPGI